MVIFYLAFLSLTGVPITHLPSTKLPLRPLFKYNELLASA